MRKKQRRCVIVKIADKVVRLLLFTKKATTCENGSFSLKERLLFCLADSPLPPRELMDALGMAKSNLALLASKCLNEGLIDKSRRTDDGRALTYSLTEKGRDHIQKLLDDIERKFESLLTDEKEKDEAAQNLDKAIELLSYLP